ncbi:hypothetical protein AURDEDRAFT_177047 [Auricularia subglabra TFB-10046 SS5]|nr:hypothetical protein AURDEDRAFT_177047 [Auricularia subglabra TFB-10046 SS5]
MSGNTTPEPDGSSHAPAPDDVKGQLLFDAHARLKDVGVDPLPPAVYESFSSSDTVLDHCEKHQGPLVVWAHRVITNVFTSRDENVQTRSPRAQGAIDGYHLAATQFAARFAEANTSATVTPEVAPAPFTPVFNGANIKYGDEDGLHINPQTGRRCFVGDWEPTRGLGHLTQIFTVYLECTTCASKSDTVCCWSAPGFGCDACSVCRIKETAGSFDKDPTVPKISKDLVKRLDLQATGTKLQAVERRKAWQRGERPTKRRRGGAGTGGTRRNPGGQTGSAPRKTRAKAPVPSGPSTGQTTPQSGARELSPEDDEDAASGEDTLGSSVASWQAGIAALQASVESGGELSTRVLAASQSVARLASIGTSQMGFPYHEATSWHDEEVAELIDKLPPPADPSV